jgi:SAM-dependent methyltransferase
MNMASPPTVGEPPEHFPGDVLEDLGDMPNYNGWIVDHFTPWLGGRAVEIGAGLGTISERMRPGVDRLDLVEPSPDLARRLVEKFAGDPDLEVFDQTLETWMAKGTPETYDSIVMVNVLEHIEDDFAAARGLYDALKVGGALMIFVPALPFLYSNLDKIYGHYRRYTKPTLRDCVSAAGFEIEKLHYVDVAGVLPWWLLNTILGKTSFHGSSLQVYDKCVVPVTRICESVLHPPFGKNLILVARKNES